MDLPLLLAFDCAGRALSAAVGDAGRVRAARREELARGHGERLFGLLGEVLQEAGVGYEDLDALAVTRGPGGFTGVRIGLAAARGLALARGLPILGATTFALAGAALQAVAPAGALAGRGRIAAIDSKRAELFVQELDGVSQPFAARPEDLDAMVAPGPLALCGDGAGRAAEALAAAGRDLLVPDGAARLDARYLPGLLGRPPLPQGPPPQPLYLRPPDVTLPGGVRAPAEG
jgi:tRNA threonylcarbamoyladenosine biosynthesis protein TsaB